VHSYLRMTNARGALKKGKLVLAASPTIIVKAT